MKYLLFMALSCLFFGCAHKSKNSGDAQRSTAQAHSQETSMSAFEQELSYKINDNKRRYEQHTLRLKEGLRNIMSNRDCRNISIKTSIEDSIVNYSINAICSDKVNRIVIGEVIGGDHYQSALNIFIEITSKSEEVDKTMLNIKN